MNEKAKQYTNRLQVFWNKRTGFHKGALIASALLVLLIIAIVIAIAFRTNYAPLYSQLTLAETGQIQEVLESRGVSSQVTNDGTTIKVPEADVDRLKVELAAEGLPQSGSIDYGFFQEQMGFGMTDNEFTVIERSLMQTELAELIRGVSGVTNANVIITMPEESVWLNSGQESATAAVVLELAAGNSLDPSQVKALYHLISRSVPNLPVENIVLSDSNFTNYTYQEEDELNPVASFQSQREIKQEIESDLKQTIMQLLGAVVGPQNAIVSVTTDIDFTQEQRIEDLVEPVNEEDMTGIAISAERINEMYEGVNGTSEGVAGTADEIPNYTGAADGAESESERTEERLNYEVNRIHKEIIESPYQIRDISIQAMINPPEGLQTLPPQQSAELNQLLATIIQTTLPEAEEGTINNVTDRVSITSMPFAQEAQATQESPATSIPTWMYITAGFLLVLIIVLVLMLLRKQKQTDLALDEPVEEGSYSEDEPIAFPERPETDERKQMKELAHLANEKPEEFSKLLRTWLSDD